MNCGDIILSYNGGVVAWAIRGILRFFDPMPVRFSHCLICYNDTDAIEAAGSGVKFCKIKKALKVRNFVVIRFEKATPEQLHSIVKFAHDRIGENYGYLRLGLHLLDKLSGSLFFTGLFRRGDVVKCVCSSLVAEGYDKVLKIKFDGSDWNSVDPDNIDDEAARPGSGWVLVQAKGKRHRCGKTTKGTP